ncbi:MAG: succinate--CoA ligase subunit alpha, partial [Nitrosopumilaceae archaeon]
MADLFEILIGTEGEKDYKKKPVMVQGITGKFGSFHTQQMLAYGTNIVAGITPGKGGQKFGNVPIYETVKKAVAATGAKISVVFVPAKFFRDAAIEALEAGI